jgi:hypothetical protein
VYHIWKIRCQTHHGLSTDEHHKRSLLSLTPIIQDIYDQQEDLNNDQQYIFQMKIEDLLSRPVVTIRTWVHKPNLRIKCIKNRMKAKRKQEKSKIVQLHPFFTTATIVRSRSQTRNPLIPSQFFVILA